MGNISKKYCYLTAFFCVLTVFLRFFMLAGLPEGLHVDEAGMAYDAWSLSQFGVDRYRNSWPVYLINYGGGQSALYCYLAIPFIRLFGLSAFSVRIPGALFSIMTLLCGLGIIRLSDGDNETKARLCAVFAFLFAITPYFFMSARFGLDCNLMLGASTLAIWTLMRAVRQKGTRRYLRFFIAGTCFGLILYTYAISYVVVPLFLLIAFISLLVCRKIRIPEALCFAVPLSVLAAPLVCLQYINSAGLPSVTIGKITLPALLFYRSSEISAPTFSGIAATLKSVFLYDWLDYNSVPQFGNLYYLSIPFALIGISSACVHAVRNYRRREFTAGTAVLWWLFCELLTGSMLGGDGPNCNKLNGAFMAALYFTATGIVWLISRFSKNAARAAAAVTASVYLVFAVLFFRYYFIVRPGEYSPYYLFQKPLDESVACVKEDPSLAFRNIYIVNRNQPYVQPYIYYMLAAKTSPWDADILNGGNQQIANFHFGSPEEIDPEGIYIVLEGNDEYLEALAESGFTVRQESDGSTVVY